MDEASELEAKFGNKSIRAKSKHLAEVIAIMALTLLALVAYGGFLHMQDTRDSNAKTVQVLEKITDTNAAQSAKTVAAIREQTCLLSLTEAERKADFASPFSWCKRMTQ